MAIRIITDSASDMPAEKARIRRYFEKAIETSRNTTQMYENLLQRSINPENE